MNNSVRLLFTATLLLTAAGVVPASADNSYKACKVGDRVTNRDGKTGTVTQIESEGTYCYVDVDGGEKHSYYIFWMLRRAGTPLVNPAKVAKVLPGRYTCYAGNPIQYTFSDIIVKSASAYTDNKGNAGTYSYVPATQMITFQSGSFKGAFAKYRDDYSIGLASKPSSFFATVCGLTH